MQNFNLTARGVKKSYQFPESLNEIPLKRLIDYQSTIEILKPETLFKVESLSMNQNDAANYLLQQTQEEKKTWFDFYAQQVAFWCNMSFEEARLIKVIDLLKLRNFLANTLSNFTYDENMTEFNHKGVKYLVAESFMNDSILIDFIEAMEYEHRYQNSLEEIDEADTYKVFIRDMKNNKYKVLPKIMSLVCRKLISGKPEAYHDKIVEQNESDMLQVNCTAALNVAFFLLKRNTKFINGFPTLQSRRV